MGFSFFFFFSTSNDQNWVMSVCLCAPEARFIRNLKCWGLHQMTAHPASRAMLLSDTSWRICLFNRRHSPTVWGRHFTSAEKRKLLSAPWDRRKSELIQTLVKTVKRMRSVRRFCRRETHRGLLFSTSALQLFDCITFKLIIMNKWSDNESPGIYSFDNRTLKPCAALEFPFSSLNTTFRESIASLFLCLLL